jgi:hypothetical protein
VAVNYQIKAGIVDVQFDRPQSSDVMLVDSNVWFWMTYLGSGLGNEWRARVYPAYVKAARKAKARLLRCGISLAELAHGIERAEFDVFEKTHPQVHAKEFRHNYVAERAAIVTDVQNSWRIVKSMASPVSLAVDERATDAALQAFQAQNLDGHDLFMVEAMETAGVHQVLTDDGDYSTVPNIQVFTANRQVLEAARRQGKLLLRGSGNASTSP